MNKVIKDFVSEEEKSYKFRLGTLIASSLSGFIAGMVVASALIWVLLNYFEVL